MKISLDKKLKFFLIQWFYKLLPLGQKLVKTQHYFALWYEEESKAAHSWQHLYYLSLRKTTNIEFQVYGGKIFFKKKYLKFLWNVQVIFCHESSCASQMHVKRKSNAFQMQVKCKSNASQMQVKCKSNCKFANLQIMWNSFGIYWKSCSNQCSHFIWICQLFFGGRNNSFISEISRNFIKVFTLSIIDCMNFQSSWLSQPMKEKIFEHKHFSSSIALCTA